MRNLQEQVKKAFCYQKLFWPFTAWINCSSDLKNFANSRPSASNFKSICQSLEYFSSQYVRTNLVKKYQLGKHLKRDLLMLINNYYQCVSFLPQNDKEMGGLFGLKISPWTCEFSNCVCHFFFGPCHLSYVQNDFTFTCYEP